MSTIHRSLATLAALAALLATPPGAGTAAALELQGEAEQGGLMLGRVAPGTRVIHDGDELRVTGDGRFVLGFDRDAEADSSLVLHRPDGSRERHELSVRQREYRIQRIDGLPERQVTPPAEDLARIREEAERLAEARRQARATESLHLDSLDFEWPVTGRITGVYGSQRILNGEPRRPHVGLDIAAPPGTPVHAPAPGRVVFTHPGMFFNGATVLMDHGHGLASIYIHLHGIHVEPGQWLDTGDLLGEVGASGRATGPHLHWEVSWLDARLDPQRLVGEMPAD